VLGCFNAEKVMPHRRRVQKGSFGTHFDELVEHFPNDEPLPKPKPALKPKRDSKEIHDSLFEGAWRPRS
jgi:hypothetical protein